MVTFKVEELQQKQVATEWSHMVHEGGDDNDDEGPARNLVMLTESMQVFFEMAFSSRLANADRRKRVEHIGMPSCDIIWCPKLRDSGY